MWSSEVPFPEGFDHHHASPIDEFLAAEADRGRRLHGERFITTGEALLRHGLPKPDRDKQRVGGVA